jgi:hypothetical protein
MKIDINGTRVQCTAIELESVDCLRSIRIEDMGGIRCDRFTRPHQGAMFRSDDEKRCYGNVSEALDDNVPWLGDKLPTRP